VTDEPDVDVIADAGAALELLHGYFLVHDDWMDGDLVRRNGPSVHATLRTKLGDDALGDAAAIMAGDWGVAVATDWMARLAVKPQLLSRALQCFTAMQLAAVTGQIRDLLATDDRPEITYELKTASYTVSGPLRLGAILGGAKDSTLSDLERFALPIGVAFQLRDDLIGVFSPEAVTGKPFASDIKQGKRTVLALEGRRRADGAMLKRWNRVFGNATSSRRDLESVVEFLEHCGAKDAVERRISKLYSESLAALDGARLKPRGKELLRSAAAALIVRGS
jgi:geranylgeranyl diphosphate synthase type I